MLLLALDTSTSAVTVALHDGRRTLAEDAGVDARAHAEHLAPLVRDVLAAAGRRPEQVTDVVAGTGPGPFTGLRVGLVTAEVFAWAVGASYGGLCSLDALAHAARATDPEPLSGGFVVATDARRRELYLADYAVADGAPVRTGGPVVLRPGDVGEKRRALPCVGRGPLLYPDRLGPAQPPLDVPAAALADLAAARLAAGDALDPPRPRYLRRPDARPRDVRDPAVPGPR